MIRRMSHLVFCLWLCSSISLGQVTPDSEPANSPNAERESEIRQQAVQTLKSTLTSTNSIGVLKDRAEIVAETSLALWQIDNEFARHHLNEFVGSLLREFEELVEKRRKRTATRDDSERQRMVESVIRYYIKTISREDFDLADSLKNKYLALKDEGESYRDQNSGLEMALDGSELDRERALALFTALLHTGVPSRFPHTLRTLRERDPELASEVLYRAVQFLAIRPNYTSNDALLIGVAVLGEQAVIVPELATGSEPGNFGVFTSFIGGAVTGDVNLITRYYLSTDQFLRTRMTASAYPAFYEPDGLLKAYFLIEKLKAYQQMNSLGVQTQFDTYRLAIGPAMGSAGFSQDTLLAITTMARQVVLSSNPLGLDDGSSFLERAEQEKDPKRKLYFLVRAIERSIESGRFSEAERLISDIRDGELRDVLGRLHGLRFSEHLVRQREWLAFENVLQKQSDSQVRSYILLNALSSLEDSSDEELMSSLSNRAETFIDRISDKQLRADGLVFLAYLAAKSSREDSMPVVLRSLKAVSEVSEFRPDAFRLKLEISVTGEFHSFVIGSGAFEKMFGKLALLNWNEAQLQASQIKPEYARARAGLSAASAVLNKIDKSKPKEAEQ